MNTISPRFASVAFSVVSHGCATRQLPAQPEPPSAPTDLAGIRANSSQINLNWTDTSTIESGFLVERSSDNLNFTQIASLPANSSSFSDTNLPPTTSYYCRSRAWNSTGNSPYSNVTTAATQAPPPQTIDQLVSSEWSGGGKVSGTFDNTWSKNGVLESTTATQSFTFAYSTSSASLSANKAGWIDMFSVTSSNSGTKQFTLPASLSGPVYVSVRDNSRVAGVATSNSVKIDYLTIRTNFGS